MADIAHVLPSTISLHPRFSMGLFRPGVQTVNYRNGRSHSRDYGSYTYKTYAIHPSIFTTDNALLAEWEAFWDQINGGEDEAYIMEPLTLAHKLVPCGPITDGTRTCFPTNIVDLAGETVYVDGLPISSDDYTLHSAANVLSDDKYCVPTAVGDFTTNSGTETISAHTLFGASSLKISQAGVATHYVYPNDTITAAEGDTLTASVWIYETKASGRPLAIGFYWYTAADALIGSSVPVTADVPQYVWTNKSYTATAPATTAYARMRLTCGAVTTGTYYATGFSASPGDYDRLWLPSVAPAVIEFDTAPAANSRVYVSGTGQRITRCRFDLDTRWTYQQNDNQQVSGIRATEVLEY